MEGNVKWTTFTAKEFVQGINREDIRKRVEQESKKTFRIPMNWEMCGYVEVEASSLEEAYGMVEESDFPDERERDYVESSFLPSYDITEYAKLNKMGIFDKKN